MSDSTALVWFRTDLRIRDNQALQEALSKADRVVAIYIHESEGPREITGAARWWLHHSLNALAADLIRLGVELRVESGNAEEVLGRVLEETGAEALFWNRRYGPNEREVDASVKETFRKRGLTVESFAGHLLLEPWQVETKQGEPYSVFTPFWKAVRQRHDISEPFGTPRARSPDAKPKKVDTDYKEPQWAQKLSEYWTIGEDGARSALKSFLDERIDDYSDGRDRPAKTHTSKLSPHLRFGEITPRQVWYAAKSHAAHHSASSDAIDTFLSELAWRDFNYTQLYYRRDIANHPMKDKYESMRWRDADAGFEKWTRGETGLPMVDAGMRELWQTGSMHNRIRMLTASLLTKNLLVDWKRGERWFWDCLVDADPANNPSNWQWVAGCGLDASPYFRVFNPVTQGEKFDPSGGYIRRWVPELAELPDKYIHRPHEAPESVLKKAGVELDKTYPRPIVDLKTSRQRAIDRMGDL
ncbi:deoxyribodipyrimidine photo-lyase [Devosia pacifica]|uniref:Deoxyribodipyrimidine photo-lyase n=1 Tax=Devosia pacifica TaxID=1335967 RepID=A0A918RTW8_9HYPH|nr:deoxyribodipyrimidine photo-lyase [Devosia pacifica]GHA10869.1 deoxyribodipyrimidine photo-lyase [Devosia pacifica]